MTNVENVVGALSDALARTTRSLLVKDADFGASLRLGQIIKGRVLRQVEPGRYLMDFAGRERVVDSTLALRVSEWVTARVVAVGDQVHLQRLAADGEAAAELAAPLREAPLANRNEQLVQELFERYQATLSGAERAALARSIARATDPARMGLSGLLLGKLGVTLAPELLDAVYRRLDAAKGAQAPAAAPDALRVEVEQGVSRDSASALGARERLAEHLRSLLEDTQTMQDARTADGDAGDARAGGEGASGGGPGRDDARWLLGQWLLNVQSHPRIAQRLVRLPLWLGDRIVEVSVALLSEREPETASGIRFGHAALFLDLPHLGRVQVTLRAADRSLRATLSAEREEATTALARHAAALREDLARCGWEVAEASYLQATLSPEGAVLDTVVHHHLTPDSLSRWM